MAHLTKIQQLIDLLRPFDSYPVRALCALFSSWDSLEARHSTVALTLPEFVNTWEDVERAIVALDSPEVPV